MTNEIYLDIAGAKTRLAKTWHNSRVTWKELCRRCKEVKRTGETVKQYAAMSRDRQSKVKDVGGFVCGYLAGGVRKTANVRTRSAVTLDVDFATPDTWEDFCMRYDGAALCYSTHKHTEEKPRLRIIIPAARNMQPHEYEPIARYFAKMLGIERVDHTTYQLPRLFYWPSASKDGAFFYDDTDGAPFSPDEILATYRNPFDASEWPVSEKEGAAVVKTMEKAGDPTEKPGIIGAFCRAYTIEDAVEELLADKYEPTATPGRYTYTEGHVAGGLVCYEGKFAYSHHETDPAGGKLLNAFDLVRVHKFGDMDGEKEYDDPTRRPSYKAMLEFAAKDKRTRRILSSERMKGATDDFDGMEDAEDEKWLEELDTDKAGRVKSTAANLDLIFRNDKGLKGRLWVDEFSGYNIVTGGLPWDPDATTWKDRDDANVRAYLEKRYGITGKEKISDAVTVERTRNRRHPVREYLNGIEWDGVRRLETVIIDTLGADDTPLVRAMTRKHFTAAVARVFRPGAKYDYCLVLCGPEGIGKSTLFAVMGGDWFTDSVFTTEGKDGMDLIRGAWVVELAELSAIRYSEAEKTKAFISRQFDTYRPAYSRTVERIPRQCVFCGTTNEAAFLKGENGNRRFWVIPVKGGAMQPGQISEHLKGIRDQLWAEAVKYYKDGEKLYLGADLEAEAKELQAQYNENHDDPVTQLLPAFLERKLPAEWDTWSLPRRRAFFNNPDPLEADATEERVKFCAAEFICEKLGKNMQDKDFRYLARRVFELMRQNEEWEEVSMLKHVTDLYGRQKGFRRVLKSDKSNNEMRATKGNQGNPNR